MVGIGVNLTKLQSGFVQDRFELADLNRRQSQILLDLAQRSDFAERQRTLLVRGPEDPASGYGAGPATKEKGQQRVRKKPRTRHSALARRRSPIAPGTSAEPQSESR